MLFTSGLGLVVNVLHDLQDGLAGLAIVFSHCDNESVSSKSQFCELLSDLLYLENLRRNEYI
jgi:hypothetical protein